MGTLRRSEQRTDEFLLARPAGSLSNFKENSKRACSQATISPTKNNDVHNIKRKKMIFQPAVLTQVEIRNILITRRLF
jgi:hypothetical protein